MNKWNKAAKHFFEISDPTGAFFHCAKEGNDLETISKIEAKIGVGFPDELRDFYQHFNGLGMSEDESELPRFIPPVEHLPELVKSARSWLSKTHSQLAARYLPVVDWENGDSSGYLLDENGVYLPHFFIFNHELYQDDAEQDGSEFLQPMTSSLLSFLAD